jgi:quercetin dioxygenase-like cupin family protein
MTIHGSIRNLADFKRYSPPGHTGTSNLRLVEKGFCGAFEMVHGTIDPGCGAERHSHETEAQVCYVLDGEMEVTFDDDPPVRCGAGAVVEIPSRVDHHIINCGDTPLRLLVIYSPPLPLRGDTPLDG